MARRNIIVIGGSAGSLTAAREIVSALPLTINATLFVSVHRSLHRGSDYFAKLLAGDSNWRTAIAVDCQIFEPGWIYIAPPESQMSIEADCIRVTMDAKGYPPRTIDALFESAAHTHRERVLGIVLSGMLDDGASGCWEIRKHGGITIAQDPEDSVCASMPAHSMRAVPLHYCLPTKQIAPTVQAVATGALAPAPCLEARVMIVEDEWTLASELERQLGDLHYIPVAKVSSGEEALKEAENAMPDIIIMDVGLAGRMKGTEAATRLWQRFKVPIIFLTARSDQETIVAAQLAVPYAFITKPHSPPQLHAAIQLALGRLQAQGDGGNRHRGRRIFESAQSRMGEQ